MDEVKEIPESRTRTPNLNVDISDGSEHSLDNYRLIHKL